MVWGGGGGWRARTRGAGETEGSKMAWREHGPGGRSKRGAGRAERASTRASGKMAKWGGAEEGGVGEAAEPQAGGLLYDYEYRSGTLMLM